MQQQSTDHPANEAIPVIADITDFSGDNDMRVFVSQFTPGQFVSLLWPNIIVSGSNVNTTNKSCLIWLHNCTGFTGRLTRTVYLTTVAKN